MTEVGPTMNNVYGSCSSSLAWARRPSSERTKMRDPEEGTGASPKGTNQRSSTPALATQVIPRDDPPSALLAAQLTAYQGKKTPSDPKDQCFHATLPIKNNLTWAEKEECPEQWLRQGSNVLVVCNTGCTKTLVSESFVDDLGLRKKEFQEGKSTKVCLGNL